MTASRPDNEAIFHTARDIPDPDRRREYVRQACGGDEARIAHVEALLAAAAGPDSLLDRPAAAAPGATIDQIATESPRTVIGPYKLVEQIGEGGMGSVWMAQQTEPVKRLVAVKFIKAGMDSRQVIARFEAERQALALMDHPNIARVLDGGTTSDGRPYFVMDLVKGVPITRYCDEHHLTPRQRLELFIPVCQAVQHAHQKGIIHRDLKPSNVLVARYDGNPVPKVIDFGVAKAAGQQLTDKTLVTGIGAVVGTLEYMSPEQAELNQLDIDTRSDIYALGVLLYELLTGSPPFSRKELTQAGMLEMLRVIREQEPSKPSTKLSTAEGLPTLAANRGTEPAKLTKLVRGELDWIVMKALEKDRNRRYETANGFAMDVQRYLADEPVLACPPSAGYRLRKFVRKNRGPVIAAALILLSLVGGAIGAVYGVIESGKQRTAALQRQIEDEQRASAAAADRAARRSRTAASVATALDDARARTGEAWALADEPYKMQTATDLVLAAVRRAEGFADAGEAPEETLAELAAVRAAVADLDRHTRLFVAADQALQAQDWLRENEPGRERTAEKLGAAFRAFGWDLVRTPADTIAAEIAASRARNKLLGFLCDWENTGPARRPEQIPKVIRAARLRSGGLLADWQRMKDAADLDGLAAFAARPEVLTLGPELLCALSRDLRFQPRSKEAHLALLRRAADRYPAHVWVNDELYLACSFAFPPRGLEALRAAAAAAAIRPDNVFFQRRVARAYADLGMHDLAVTQYRKVIALAPTDRWAYQSLADLYTRAGDPSGVAAVWRECLERVPDYVPAYVWLGTALLQAKDPAGAADAFREAIRRKADDATAHDRLGLALRALGDLDGGIAAHKEALRIVRRYLGRSTYYLINPNETLWAALVEKNARLGMAGDAAALAAFAEMTRLDPQDPWPHVQLGTLLWDRGDTKGAIARYRDAVQIEPLRIDPAYDQALRSLGSALLAERDYAGAVAAYRGLIRRWPIDPSVRLEVAGVLAQTGDLEGAIAEYNEAIRNSLNPKDGEAHAVLAKMLAAGPDGVRDGKKAVEHATRACELSLWKEPRHISILAAAYAEAGDFAKAVEYQKKALTFPEYEQQHGAPMRKRLDLYVQQKPFRETDWKFRSLVAPPGAAVWRYWQAVNRDPKNAVAHYNLGNALRAAGQLDGSEAAYREAVRLDGDHHGAAIDALAELLLSRGNLKDAIATYQRIVVLAPEDASMHYRLGNALKAKGDREEALAAYRAAAAAAEKKNPADANSLYNAACYRALTAAALAQARGPDAARLAKEEADRATDRLTKAIAAGFADMALLVRDDDLEPLRDRVDFRKLLADLVAKASPVARARYYILLSQWDKAASEYARADLKVRPLQDDASARAGLLLIRGDNEGYNRFCLGLIEVAEQKEAPSSWEAYVLARCCAMGRKSPADPARAVRWANKAIASSHNPWDFHALGLAQYRAGQFDQALQSFTKADVKEWESRGLNWFGLALVHHGLRHPDEARQFLDKGIQWLEREGPSGPERSAKIHPMDWVEAQLLRREAEEVLKTKPDP